MIRASALLVLGAMVIASSSCGWQLRGLSHNPVPSSLALASETRMDALTLAVKAAMRQRAINLSEQAPWKLILGREQLNKRVVAVTQIGSPSQYELTLTANYRYIPTDAQEREINADGDSAIYPARTLSTTRVYDFDPADTVAKSEEEGVLLDEMRRELAHRLLESAPSDG